MITTAQHSTIIPTDLIQVCFDLGEAFSSAGTLQIAENYQTHRSSKTVNSSEIMPVLMHETKMILGPISTVQEVMEVQLWYHLRTLQATS